MYYIYEKKRRSEVTDGMIAAGSEVSGLSSSISALSDERHLLPFCGGEDILGSLSTI